jgi:hypothetical protein
LRELQPVFPGTPRRPVHVFVHAGTEDLPPALQAVHHPGSPGFALPEARTIHLLAREMRDRLDGGRAVVVHELVHVLLHEFVAPHGNQLPRWLHEGLAQLLAGDNYLGASEEDLVWRSHSYVSFLAHEIGRDRLLAAIKQIDGVNSLDRVLGDAAGRNTLALYDAWLDYLVHGSGARWRTLLDNCFSLSMILVLPLLALALIRRTSADRKVGERMQQREAQEAEAMPIPDVADPDAERDPEPDSEADGRSPGTDPGRREGGGA